MAGAESYDTINSTIQRRIDIELPIERIAEHSRKEKNMRAGHPWHVHNWRVGADGPTAML
jgi:hypothetical protein